MMWSLVPGDPRQFLYAPPHETKDCIAVLEPLTNGWRVTMPVTELGVYRTREEACAAIVAVREPGP